MKLELIGHDEKYALEQSLLTLFPGEKPVYGTVDKTADTRWARVTLTEEDERVQVTTELGMDGKSAAHSYDYPLSGTDYEKEGQRRHAVGISFFGAAVISSKSASKYGSTSENDFSTLCATKLQYAHRVGQNGMPT